MDSTTKAVLAGGFAAGYVVGRNNKEKLALSLLSLATGRALDPMSLIGQGIRKLAASPQFEQLSESVASALEQRRRGLTDAGTPTEAPGADAGEAEDAGAGEDIRRAPLENEGPEETEETDEQEGQRPQSSRRRPAKRKNPGKPSAHAAGPKNPPAARAKAMGGKARAERATRRPGPKNPPAAKAMARKAADKHAAAEETGKKAPARAKRHS